MVSHTTMMDFISILIMFLHIHRFLTIPSDFQMIPMEDIIYSLDSQLMSLQLVWMCLTIPTGRSVCFVLTCSATSVCAPIASWASYLVERVRDWNFVQVEFADVLRIVTYDACAQKTRRSLCLFYQICFGDWSHLSRKLQACFRAECGHEWNQSRRILRIVISLLRLKEKILGAHSQVLRLRTEPENPATDRRQRQ